MSVGSEFYGSDAATEKERRPPTDGCEPERQHKQLQYR